ncbi:MAG: guanylate kinase [Pseudomonadota bacterium]
MSDSAKLSFPTQLKRRGLMFVLSSPSGAGKTTISRLLMERDDNIRVSISATTRNIRPGEVDGQHYHFVSPEKFDEMIENKEFLEYANVFGKQYGTPRAPVEEALQRGTDVLFDIDWQGTRRISEQAAQDVVSIFILPPSWDELENRLKSRGQDSPAEIEFRMSRAVQEISHYAEYDYVIINRDLEDALRRVQAILVAERMKRRRLSGLENFINQLQPDYDPGRSS